MTSFHFPLGAVTFEPFIKSGLVMACGVCEASLLHTEPVRGQGADRMADGWTDGWMSSSDATVCCLRLTGYILDVIMPKNFFFSLIKKNMTNMM